VRVVLGAIVLFRHDAAGQLRGGFDVFEHLSRTRGANAGQDEGRCHERLQFQPTHCHRRPANRAAPRPPHRSGGWPPYGVQVPDVGIPGVVPGRGLKSAGGGSINLPPT